MVTSYYYQASKSKTVRISLSERGWAIYLNDRLLYDRYGSAEEAALCASRKDFGDQMAIELFNGVSVPSVIEYWRQTPPELHAKNKPKPKSCKDRHRRPGLTQLAI